MSQPSSRHSRKGGDRTSHQRMTFSEGSDHHNNQNTAQSVPRPLVDFNEWSLQRSCAHAAQASTKGLTRGTDSMEESQDSNCTHMQSLDLVHPICQISISTEGNDSNNLDVTPPISERSNAIASMEQQAAAVDSKAYSRSPASQRRSKHGPNRKTGMKKEPAVPGHERHSASGHMFQPAQAAHERPYTASLGVPDLPGPASSREPSESSDAGQQLRLRKCKPGRSSNVTETSNSLQSSGGSDSARGSQYELQKRIFTLFQKTKNHHGQDQDFLPEGGLRKLVDVVSVRRELTKTFGNFHSPAQIETYTHDVCRETRVHRGGRDKIKTFHKIFALLVLVGAPSSILLFIEEDVSDLDLPLDPLGDQGIEGMCRKNGSRPLRCFEQPHWSPIQLRNFQDYQWKLLAPYFAQGKHGDVIHYPLHDRHILPFIITQVGGGWHTDKAGGYGTVSMVHIHPEHHNFQDKALSSRGFAVKRQLHADDRETFKKEIVVLKKFSGDRGHDHIVSLLATFEQFERLNLVFYRADGDLLAFWSTKTQGPDITFANINWMAEQCDGLVRGLLKLHKHLTFEKQPNKGGESLVERLLDSADRTKTSNAIQNKVKFDDDITNWRVGSPTYSRIHFAQEQETNTDVSDVTESSSRVEKQYGRHGDIHPGNILWFNNEDGKTGQLSGTLKIADFGQTELNSIKSRTQPRDVANQLTYRPPECDRLEDDNPQPIRQTYDMWCLGCVFLEFVAWMLGGEELQKTFMLRRMSPDFFQNKQLTDTFFQVTRNQDTDSLEVMVKPVVTQFIDELHQYPNCTTYCHELLTLIQLDMLVVDSARRKPCDGVSRTLHKMLRRCRIDEDYAAKPSPWLNSRRSISESMFIDSTSLAPELMRTEVAPQPAQPDQPRKRHLKRGEKRRSRGGFSPR